MFTKTKHVTSISSTPKSEIKLYDAGQRVPYFDNCEFTITRIFAMKVDQGETAVDAYKPSQTSLNTNAAVLRAPLSRQQRHVLTDDKKEFAQFTKRYEILQFVLTRLYPCQTKFFCWI